MAIDTAEKRKSASGIQVILIAGVTPNSSKDQEWRQEAGWGYSGIETASPVTYEGGAVRMLFRTEGRTRYFKSIGRTRFFRNVR